MEFIIEEFKKRVDEIDCYISFVEFFEGAKKISFSNSNKQIEIKSKEYKILKANIYLLLYNVVEYSFKNSLKKIHETISNDSVKFQQVIDEIKKYT